MAGGERADENGRDGVSSPLAGNRDRRDELIDGYVVPVDPMDGLQCESCQ